MICCVCGKDKEQAPGEKGVRFIGSGNPEIGMYEVYIGFNKLVCQDCREMVLDGAVEKIKNPEKKVALKLEKQLKEEGLL